MGPPGGAPGCGPREPQWGLCYGDRSVGSGKWGMALADIILRLKEPKAEACCTGSELLASFRPVSRRKEKICHDPAGRLEWSLSSTHSCRDPSNPGLCRSFPSGCTACWARCWTLWITCINRTSSTGNRGPGCLRRKDTESPQASVPVGRIEGERCGPCSQEEGGTCPEHLPGLRRMSPPPPQPRNLQ